MSRFKDLTGNVYGRLTVTGLSEERVGKEKRQTWECVCSCGKKTKSIAKNLRSGAKKSCGCLRAEAMAAKMTKHGGSEDRLYPIWKAMKARCHRPTDADYCYYGARGITVCQRWINDYGAFKSDVGDGWEDGLTLDRIDNDGNYEPGNVKWSTMSEQARNKRPPYSVFPTRRNR